MGLTHFIPLYCFVFEVLEKQLHQPGISGNAQRLQLVYAAEKSTLCKIKFVYNRSNFVVVAKRIEQ